MQTHRNAGDLGDGLHAFNATDADLGYPERAGHVRPLVTRACALHRTALVRAEHALGPKSQRTCPAQPGPGWYRCDAVARLVHTDVAAVAEDHLVPLFRVRLNINTLSLTTSHCRIRIRNL